MKIPFDINTLNIPDIARLSWNVSVTLAMTSRQHLSRIYAIYIVKTILFEIQTPENDAKYVYHTLLH